MLGKLNLEVLYLLAVCAASLLFDVPHRTAVLCIFAVFANLAHALLIGKCANDIRHADVSRTKLLVKIASGLAGFVGKDQLVEVWRWV